LVAKVSVLNCRETVVVVVGVVICGLVVNVKAVVVMNPSANEFVPSWLKSDSGSGSSGSSKPAGPKLTVNLPKPRKIVVANAAAPETESAPPRDKSPAAVSAEKSLQPAPSAEISSNEAEVDDSVRKDCTETVTRDEKELAAGTSPASAPADGAAADVDELEKKAGALEVSSAPASASASKIDEAELEADGEQSGLSGAGEFSEDGRKTVNLVFIGHVDAGKSTISGHLLYLTGNVDDRTMEKYEREAKAKNRESWKYAWALDLTDNERDKGKTEECGRASFTTETRRFVILDAPGHKSFVPQMIGGASQADVGMLVISARKGEFETGFERGGQTREHAMLAKTSGVRQLMIIINKMDDPSIVNPDGTWSQARYDECIKKLWPFLKGVGWKQGDVNWVPASGLTGMNLKDPVPKDVCSWYDGESVIDTLEHLKPPERLLTAPVKLPVFERYKEMGGLMLMGKLEAGVITVGDKLVLMPNRLEFTVDGIHLEEAEKPRAEPGDNVRLRVKGVEEEEVRSGFVACSPADLVQVSSLIDVRLMLLEHRSIITAGYSAVMHIHSVVEECTIEMLMGEFDKKTGKIAQKFPKFAKPGMSVYARIRLAQPICVEEFKAFPQLGRFMIRDEGRTIGVGLVLKVCKN